MIICRIFLITLFLLSKIQCSVQHGSPRVFCARGVENSIAKSIATSAKSDNMTYSLREMSAANYKSFGNSIPGFYGSTTWAGPFGDMGVHPLCKPMLQKPFPSPVYLPPTGIIPFKGTLLFALFTWYGWTPLLLGVSAPLTSLPNKRCRYTTVLTCCRLKTR